MEVCRFTRDAPLWVEAAFSVTEKTPGHLSRNNVLPLGSKCHHADSNKEAGTGSGHTVEDNFSRNPLLIKLFAFHSTHTNEVGDHTKTKFKSENSFCRLGIQRSAVCSETHCTTIGATTWSTTLLDCGKITRHASVQKTVTTVGIGTRVQLQKSVYGLSDAPEKFRERHDKSRMESLENRANFRLKDESTVWQRRRSMMS